MKGLSVTLLLSKSLVASRSKSKEADIIHSARLGSFSADAATYTSSVDIDPRILSAVIEVNMAHILMLSKQQIVSRSAAKMILSALHSIPNNLVLDEFLEDVHMNVEDYVISKVGKDIGGMLNLAKSRNDQVATALRIALRGHLIEIARKLIDLEEALIDLASKNASLLMPGYTHLQRAQPITAGHQLLAHEEALERDFERVLQCYSRVNQCPMGAGALASSSFTLDRKSVALLLGFKGLVENSLDAVSSRDFAVESVYVCSQIMCDLSALAEEIVLWTSKEFSFATISDKFAATSSMMPQKKNAIVPEVARARASQVVGDLVGALGIMKALPLSYNLDLQELTRNLWSSVDKTRDSLSLLAGLISELQFNQTETQQAVQNDETLLATELADYLVSEYDLSFREAHSRVGKLVKSSELSGHLYKAFTQTPKKKLSSILGVSIPEKQFQEILNPYHVLSKRKTEGSPNPQLVKQSCLGHGRLVSRQSKIIGQLERDLSITRKSLRSQVRRGSRPVRMMKGEHYESSTSDVQSRTIRKQTEVK